MSIKNGTFYIGQTNDLLTRFEYHNSGRSDYTKNKGPWVLVGFKRCLTRSSAMKEENRLKKLKNKYRLLEEFGLIPEDFTRFWQ